MNLVTITNDFATRKFLHYPPDEGFARWKISGTLAKGSFARREKGKTSAENCIAWREIVRFPPDDDFARWEKGRTPAKSCFAQWKIVRYPPDEGFAWWEKGGTLAENCLAWREIVRYPSDDDLAWQKKARPRQRAVSNSGNRGMDLSSADSLRSKRALDRPMKPVQKGDFSDAGRSAPLPVRKARQ